MGKQRGVLKALIVGAIPVLNVFLFYSWCNEIKLRWKIAKLNSTLYSVLFIFPIISIYPIYQFLLLVQSNLEKEGKKAYLLPPLLLAISTCLIFPWLYIVFATQSLFNENNVDSLWV